MCSASLPAMFQPPVLSPGSDILEQEPEEVKLGYRLWDTTSVEDRLGNGPKGFGIPCGLDWASNTLQSMAKVCTSRSRQ